MPCITHAFHHITLQSSQEIFFFCIHNLCAHMWLLYLQSFSKDDLIFWVQNRELTMHCSSQKEHTEALDQSIQCKVLNSGFLQYVAARKILFCLLVQQSRATRNIFSTAKIEPGKVSFLVLKSFCYLKIQIYDF